MLKINRKLIEQYIHHYNEKNVDAMVELFTDDAVFESVSNTEGSMITNSKEQLSNLARMNVEYFDQRKQTPVNWILTDTSAALEIVFWCRLAKDMPNGKKAGEEMTLRGTSFFEIRDGRISRLTDYM